MNLNPYLHFNGNCREAFDFYVKHLGARQLMSLTYADVPKGDMPEPGPDCKPPSKDKIMHARLQMGDSIIMGSDVPEDRQQKMAGFSLSLNLKDTAEARRLYDTLSAGGTVMMPLGETFWAHAFAMFLDRFGVSWMINVEKEQY